MYFFILCMLLIMILHGVFFLGGKFFKWENISKSVFECGFTSYFYSRFSFSIHYFLVALTFLFLDLELCFLMPFFNEEFLNLKINLFFLIFSLILTVGFLKEWNSGFIDWKN